jgi:hypothetical protein
MTAAAITSPVVTLLHLITPEDLIGCTICGAEVTLIESGCIEGHRVCAGCFGPDPVPELEPPF